MKRRLSTLLVAAVAVLTGATGSDAAAPRIVIFSGKPLAHPIVISDWGSIATIVWGTSASGSIPRARLAHRPRMTISMFWGPRWNDYVRSGKDPSALRPRQADQAGAFYPAWRGRPAVMDLPWAGEWPRPLSAASLAILRRYDVPIRLPVRR